MTNNTKNLTASDVADFIEIIGVDLGPEYMTSGAIWRGNDIPKQYTWFNSSAEPGNHEPELVIDYGESDSHAIQSLC